MLRHGRGALIGRSALNSGRLAGGASRPPRIGFVAIVLLGVVAIVGVLHIGLAFGVRIDFGVFLGFDLQLVTRALLEQQARAVYPSLNPD